MKQQCHQPSEAAADSPSACSVHDQLLRMWSIVCHLQQGHLSLITARPPLLMNAYLWSPYVIGQAIYIFILLFVLLLFFFPRLISAVADWMSTILRHMVWP